jgi:hypothetical protein
MTTYNIFNFFYFDFVFIILYIDSKMKMLLRKLRRRWLLGKFLELIIDVLNTIIFI